MTNLSASQSRTGSSAVNGKVKRRAVVAGLIVGCVLGLVAGGALAASIQCGGGYCGGTNSADTMTGTLGFDEIHAQSGQDTIYGKDGGDALYGEADADLIEGHGEADAIHGQYGNDHASYGGGLIGNNGEDDIFGFDGFDGLTGGAGADELYGNEHADVLNSWGDNQYDVVNGGNGDDTCWAGTEDFVSQCETVHRV